MIAYSGKPLQKMSSAPHYLGRSVVAWQLNGVSCTQPGAMCGLRCRLRATPLPTQARFAQLYALGSTGALGAKHTRRTPSIRQMQHPRLSFMPLPRQANRRGFQRQRLQHASTTCAGLKHVQEPRYTCKPLIGQQSAQLMKASPQSRGQRQTPRYTSASTVC